MSSTKPEVQNVLSTVHRPFLSVVAISRTPGQFFGKKLTDNNSQQSSERLQWKIAGSALVDGPFVDDASGQRRLMGLLQLRYEHDSSTIRLRFDYDSATTRYEVFRALAYEIEYENQW